MLLCCHGCILCLSIFWNMFVFHSNFKDGEKIALYDLRQMFKEYFRISRNNINIYLHRLILYCAFKENKLRRKNEIHKCWIFSFESLYRNKISVMFM